MLLKGKYGKGGGSLTNTGQLLVRDLSGLFIVFSILLLVSRHTSFV